MHLKILFAVFLFPYILVAQRPDTVGVARQVDSLLLESQNYLSKRDFTNAMTINEAAEHLSLEKKGKTSLEYGRVCYNRGAIQLAKVEYAEAETSLSISQSILSQYLDQASMDYSRTIVLLGQLYFELGRFSDCERFYLEARDLREKLYGNQHPEYVKLMHRLGVLYCEMGDFDKAEEQLLAAKNIREKSPGKESHEYAITLMQLALVYQQGTSDYEKAESAYLETKAIQEKIKGKENLYYANTVSNLGTLYVAMGNYPNAIKAHLEAKEIRARVLGKDHHQYTISLHNLADSYHYLGQYQQALELALEAKEIRGRTLGSDHPLYASTLHNLGTIYADMNQYKQAEQALLEALSIQEKKLGKGHHRYAATLNYLGTVYLRTNQLQESERVLLQAKEILGSTLGVDNLNYIFCLNNLFKTYWREGKYDLSRLCILEGSEAEKKSLLKSMRFLSEQEIEAFKTQFGNSIDRSFSFLNFDPGIAPLCYDNILFFKGYLQYTMTRIGQMAQNNPTTAVAYRAAKNCERKLAIEYSKPFSDRKNVAELEQQANILEKQLAREIAGYGDAVRQVRWQEVQAALQSNEAAVEFVDFQCFNPGATDSVFYAALVLRPGDAAPQFIPLFEKDELLPLLRGATGGNNFLKINALYGNRPAISGQKTPYELIWKPLEQAFENISTIYCSPSGLLHYLNLGAIIMPNGKPFENARHLVLLGSTRSLALQMASNRSNSEAYLAGGIRYDTDSNGVSYAMREVGARSVDKAGAPAFQPDSSVTRAGDLNYLPSTATEVREIGQMLRATNFNVKVDTGFYATEEAFRSLGVGKPSPRIVHLATHGYFFPDPKGKKSNQGSEPIFKMSEHPMIRSGLIMAGAKQTWLTGKHLEGQEDGILTAYEISQMNLTNTELVVLSACETGLGQVLGNEGVYGLQRAFKIAGVKYLIMSLWKVDDRSTKAFMAEFYKQWLEAKQSIPQAFRAAQQSMRTKYPNPYDWAGFVLIE